MVLDPVDKKGSMLWNEFIDCYHDWSHKTLLKMQNRLLIGYVKVCWFQVIKKSSKGLIALFCYQADMRKLYCYTMS